MAPRRIVPRRTQFHVRTHTLVRGARLSMSRGSARPPSIKRVCTAAHTRRRSAATRFGRLAGRKRSVNVLRTYAATRAPGTLSRSRYNSTGPVVLRVSTRSIRLGVRVVVHGRYRLKRLFAREIVVPSGGTRDDFSGRRALHDGVAYGC